MRAVNWTDERGYLRRSLVRDSDPDTFAPAGIPAGIPDLESLDWNEIKRELHNELFRRGLFAWADIQHQGDGVTGALSVIRRRVIALYRNQDKEIEP